MQVAAAFDAHAVELQRIVPAVWAWAQRREAGGEASASSLLWRPFQAYAEALAAVVQVLVAHSSTRLWPPAETLLAALQYAHAPRVQDWSGEWKRASI
jgi:hypothetical protein